MRLCLALALGLLGCGRTDLRVDGSGAVGASATGGSSTAASGGPSCTFDTERATRPGPCSAAGLECGAECGSCAGNEACFDERCYDPAGPAITFVPPLLRGLYASPEGLRCVLAAGGTLEQVEAALWQDGIDGITMDVHVSCGDSMIKATTVTLEASAFPVYEGIHSEKRSTVFELDPPLALRAGDTVAALFHAEGSMMYDIAAVSGIYQSNVDPECEFATDDANVGLAGDPWDYMARLYVHP